MANNELGNPDTLDRDGDRSEDGAFDAGVGGVARPHSEVLRENGSREVPKTRPMASVSQAAITERIAKRKLEARKAQVTVIEAGEPVPPLRLEDPITEPPEQAPAVVPAPFSEADTIRTDSGPAVQWAEEGERKGGVLPFLMVLALVAVGVLFLLNAGPAEEQPVDGDPVARAAAAAQSEPTRKPTAKEAGTKTASAAKASAAARTPVADPEADTKAALETEPVAAAQPAAKPKPAATPKPVAAKPKPVAAKPKPVAATPKPPPAPAPDPANSTAVTIHADPPDATLSIDGRAIGAAPYLGSFEPGAIVMIEAKAPGYATTFRAIKVGEQSTSVVVKLLPE